MKRWMASVLAATTLLQNPAYADIMDLPNPGDFGDGEVTPSPVPPAPGPEQQQTQFVGSVSISAMSRKSGGTLYIIDLKQALSLQRLDIRVTKNRLKILQTALITDAGQKVSVRQLTNTDVLNTGSVFSSESLNQSDRVARIELVAESYGGEADILVTVVADREVPKLTLREQQVVTPTKPEVPTQPQRPTPPAPPGPSRPPVYNPREDSVIRSGDVVYYQNSVGTVRGVYSNGQALLVRDGYYDTNVQVRDLSKSVRCYERICAGDGVEYSNSAGTALRVFANGKILLQRDGYYDSFADVRNVGKKVACVGNVCAGAKVLYQGVAGVAVAVYDNSKALIVRDGYYDSFADTKALGVKTSCDSRGVICEGDVVYHSGTIGVARAIYGNKVLLVRDGYYDTSVDADSLAKRTKCVQGVCTGARVYLSGTIGVIADVFTNGKALLQRNGYYDTMVDVGSVSLAVKCDSRSGICLGSTVIYQNTSGRVVELFANGKALVVRNGYYDTWFDVSSLARLVR
ncbi:beta-sandwich domain-containing protein [Bdellovibrio sp. 22V]|uniref:beta-sandwich domain-containing protein n=1 Tax=Bdellovibrio sp. 22V TaxID=3044166 RepID=UPI0025432CFB|nr:beta-sandwich domain-containing protein [Bdellovibrio sp. 22V]WII71254.1 beta-sandwich domain-containing protein [Bdellovibrio sp. 22V]